MVIKDNTLMLNIEETTLTNIKDMMAKLRLEMNLPTLQTGNTLALPINLEHIDDTITFLSLYFTEKALQEKFKKEEKEKEIRQQYREQQRRQEEEAQKAAKRMWEDVMEIFSKAVGISTGLLTLAILSYQDKYDAALKSNGSVYNIIRTIREKVDKILQRTNVKNNIKYRNQFFKAIADIFRWFFTKNKRNFRFSDEKYNNVEDLSNSLARLFDISTTFTDDLSLFDIFVNMRNFNMSDVFVDDIIASVLKDSAQFEHTPAYGRQHQYQQGLRK